MKFKCKPTYNFQSIEFEFELEDTSDVSGMFVLYNVILEGLKAIAPEQPTNKIKTITKEDLPTKTKKPTLFDEEEEMATEGQLKYLINLLGVNPNVAKKMTKREAWEYINENK